MLLMLEPSTLPRAIPPLPARGGLDAEHELRTACAERDDREADDERRDAEAQRQRAGPAHQTLGAGREQDEAGDDQSDVDDHAATSSGRG